MLSQFRSLAEEFGWTFWQGGCILLSELELDK
jgi:hypothetical protein